MSLTTFVRWAPVFPNVRRLTPSEYQTIWRAQHGLCAICGYDATGKRHPKDKLHADHHHATGVFRGLLCLSCNTGLGSFKDSTTHLTNAILYLRRQRAEAWDLTHMPRPSRSALSQHRDAVAAIVADATLTTQRSRATALATATGEDVETCRSYLRRLGSNTQRGPNDPARD